MFRVYCIDTSGSMDERLNGSSKIEVVKDALQASLSLMHRKYPWQRVALVAFNNQAHLVFPKADPGDFRVHDFVRTKLQANGRTNLAAGLEMAVSLLATTPHGIRREITLLSDGGANERVSDLGPILGKVRQSRATIWAISLGGAETQTSDEPLLRKLAAETHGGRFLKVSDMQGLMDAFSRTRH